MPKTNQDNIENEFRGLLVAEGYIRLLEFLDKVGTKQLVVNRFGIDFSTYAPSEGLETRKRDIRARITSGKAELIVKLGDWTGLRKEISVELKADQFSNAVEFLVVAQNT